VARRVQRRRRPVLGHRAGRVAARDPAAVFLLFSTIGFLNDIVTLGRSPFGEVLATAALSGASREGNRYVRMHTEMALAAEIHRTLVPSVGVRVGPHETHGLSSAAGEVGGDLVDIVVEEGRFLAYVADVSGHGVPAAVLMGMVKSAVRMHAAVPGTPDALLTDLNRVLRPLRRPSMFVTFAAFRGNGEGGLEYTLAGHLPVLHVRAVGVAGAASVDEVAFSQVAIGMVEGFPFTWRRISTVPGDVLAIVTDGLTEVFDGRDNEMGLEGVKQVLAAGAGAPLPELAGRILGAARRHGPQLDDQTILLVRHLL
jgi:sigma-B regulation protein RsbU (phosphoserine phosphatase)